MHDQGLSGGRLGEAVEAVHRCYFHVVRRSNANDVTSAAISDVGVLSSPLFLSALNFPQEDIRTYFEGFTSTAPSNMVEVFLPPSDAISVALAEARPSLHVPAPLCSHLLHKL